MRYLSDEKKESVMLNCFAAGFESGLQKLADGLCKPRGEKRYDKLMECTGRLREKTGASISLIHGLMATAIGTVVTDLDETHY